MDGAMLTLRGKYTNGEIELLDPAPSNRDCLVLVTFVDSRSASSRIVDTRAADARQDQGGAASAARTLETLTPREHDVLRLMPTGNNNREIAQKLGISEGTARNYVSRIYRKLDASNRAEAVAKALRWALIALD